jgi:4a-hydroxytetrahydrobiopterin dehydratase
VDDLDLTQKKCKPCEGGTKPLAGDGLKAYLLRLSGWENLGNAIAKTFTFMNYYQTIAFVNAVAFIAHQEDHHPDLEVGYKTCKVRYSTHSIGGLSENDFICAAKVDALLQNKS